MLSFYLSMLQSVEDQHEFAKLYFKYKFLMMHVANQKTNNRIWSEDIVHDAFVNIANNFEKLNFESERKTRALVSIITEHCAINFIKKESRTVILDEDESIDDYVTYRNSENHFESTAVNIIFTENVIAAINNLDAAYSIPIKLQAFGCSINEIADILDLKPSTVKSRLRRGKLQLLEMVGDENE